MQLPRLKLLLFASLLLPIVGCSAPLPGNDALRAEIFDGNRARSLLGRLMPERSAEYQKALQRRAKDFRAVRLITGDGCDLVCFGFNDGLKSDLSVPIVLNRPVLFRGSNPVASYAQSDPDRLPGSFWNGDKMFPEVLICGSLSRAQLYWCGDAFRGDGEKAILTRYGRGSHDILCVRYESPDREPQGIVTSFSLIPSMADDDVLDPYLQVTFGDSGRDPALVAIPQDGSSPDLSELPEWLHAHFLR